MLQNRFQNFWKKSREHFERQKERTQKFEQTDTPLRDRPVAFETNYVHESCVTPGLGLLCNPSRHECYVYIIAPHLIPSCKGCNSISGAKNGDVKSYAVTRVVDFDALILSNFYSFKWFVTNEWWLNFKI